MLRAQIVRAGDWIPLSSRPVKKVLEISNYPPPMCGWAMQTYLLVEEVRRRGHACEVLKINEGRQIKSAEYVDVQSGMDYLFKVFRFAFNGYRLHAHVNGESPKGFVLALVAVVAGRLTFQPAALSFHGGLPQTYFPKSSASWRLAFRLLFWLAGDIVCNSEEIKRAIVGYGVAPGLVATIPGFSAQYMDFAPAPLTSEIENFLGSHQPVFLSYVSFRPEYRLEVLRRGMQLIVSRYPGAGFVWLGFPEKEMPGARAYIEDWPEAERASLLLLGNLSHDDFLTLLSRCTAFVRTPACDGVSASVLESLSLGVPVIASENQRRPACVLTYDELDAEGLADRVEYLLAHYDDVKANCKPPLSDDNLGRTAEWLLGEVPAQVKVESVRAH